MKLALYQKGGDLRIAEAAEPKLPQGGLVVRTEACGLCSGELMTWYMDKKAPHVFGHEVAGRVIASDSPGFPVGARVFAHHHAPCMRCEFCARGLYVHCPTWRKTRLDPGGMAERFAVAADNLADTFLAGELRAQDAALIEPLACVAKSIGMGQGGRQAVVGLGSMGLMHMLALEGDRVGYELDPARRAWAQALGLEARDPKDAEEADTIYVCPGSAQAVQFALSIAAPGAAVVLFAPMPPGGPVQIDLHDAYFKDVRLANSYSCGPSDTRLAARWLREGRMRAEQVVSHFISLDELPKAYTAMQRGEILKAMVMFS